ncbi:MAG: hypothetical protein J6386_04850 [Candidatus Synoicihabitans palmerolidicus]|nr:hypothetical protein [Candidatus Synoicihabitans palmerolidicus]
MLRNSLDLLGITCIALIITVVFLRHDCGSWKRLPQGHFRGTVPTTFLKQCEDPWRSDVETAMRWRLTPSLVAHFLGLRGFALLAIPLVGMLCFSLYVAHLLRKVTHRVDFVLAGTLVITTSAAVLTPLHWFGVNDGWGWLALLVVSFSPHRTLLILTGLTAPWVDERFLIGLPFALVVRSLSPSNTMGWRDLWMLASLLTSVVLRIGMGGNSLSAEAERSFISSHLSGFAQRAGMMGLAAWMGLRAAWITLIETAWRASRIGQTMLIGVGGMTAIISFVLAWDMSRSISILIPGAVLGLIRLPDWYPDSYRQRTCIYALIALALPAVHVVGRKIDPIENLLIEAIRWIH